MPEYSFNCEKCDVSFSKVWCIADYDKEFKNTKCPKCKSKEISRDYLVDKSSINYIKGLHECKTLGEYADKQTAKLSNDHKASLRESFKTKKKPNTGIKELPSGMSRSRSPEDMPSPNTKKTAKEKRGKKK